MKSAASRLASWSGTLVIGSLTFLGLPLLALAEAPPGSWTPLFNGKDFTGWVVPAGRGAAPGTPLQNPRDTGWKIEERIVVGGQAGPGQRGGSLVSQAQFKDVELELDFLLAEHGTKCSAEVVGPNQVNASEDKTCLYNSGVYL